MGFYCDNCGGAVDLHDDFCTHCGADFEGIRCPSCGFSGPAQKFNDGCPKCGYQKKNDGFEEVPHDSEAVLTKEKEFSANPPGLFYKIAIPVLSVALIILLIILFAR